MKKLMSLFLVLTMIFALAACSSNQSTGDNSSESSASVPATESTEQPSSSDEEEPAEEPSETPSEQPETDAKTLVVYFSMPETTDPNNMTQEEDNSVVVINGEVLGNTQYVAYVIQEQTG